MGSSRALRLIFAPLLLLGACISAESSAPEDEEQETEGSISVTEQALFAAPLSATGDTTLHSGFPYNNDGNSQTLGVTAISVSDVQRAVIKFNQAGIAAAIPSGNVLYSARLDLTTTGISAGWLGDALDILRMNRSWVEGNGLGNGASWVCADDKDTSVFGNLVNNCLAADNWSMTPGAQYPQPFVSEATDRTSLFTNGLTTVSFNVTSDVYKFLQGTPNHGWIVAGSPNLVGGQTVSFASRSHSTAASRPKLIIEYGPDLCPADPNKGVPGTCGCGIPDRDTNFDGAPDCYDAVVPATADATMKLANPYGTYGKDPFVVATAASVVNLERGLVKIDTAAIEALRAGRQVKKAHLELTVAGIAVGWAGGQLGVNRMLQGWQEGTGNGGHGVTWVCANDYDASSFNFANDCLPKDGWNMPVFGTVGGPYVTAPTAITGVVWPGMKSVRFDVTSDVKAFLADPVGLFTPNHGWLIQGVPSNFLSGNWVNFASRETSAPPKLLLDFEDTCPFGLAGDSDNDGVADCHDSCASDPNKSEPGFNGCGHPDDDPDQDGLVSDPCPLDGDPTLGSGCGCPSSSLKPAGTLCVGACTGAGSQASADVCDGQGHCGDPSSCDGPIPGGNGTPIVTTTDIIWVYTDTRDAPGARLACESAGYQLPQIKNTAENGWIRSILSGDAWIGGSDAQTEGQWRWANGTGAQFWQGDQSGKPHYGRYSNWAAGQPSNSSGANDCAAIVAATGEWQARPCNQALQVVCVRPRAKMPTPSFLDDEDDGPRKTGCVALGTCGSGNDDSDCVDPSSLFPACSPINEENPETCGAATTSAIGSCDTCVKNHPNECNENADPADCESVCQAACGAAEAFAPDPNSRCDTIEDVFEGEARCALMGPVPVSATPCESNDDCSGEEACGVAFFCTEDGVTKLNACSQAIEPGDPAVEDPCPGNPDDECVAFSVCGTPNSACATGDFGVPTEPCTEYDLCVEPGNEIVVAEPSPQQIADLLTPSVLDPQQQFGNEQLPTLDPVNPWHDPACTGAGCSPATGEDHAWCKYELREQLDKRDAEQTKHTDAGPGNKLTFKFDPKFNLDYEIAAGPLGIPLPNVFAEASLAATTDIKLFNSVEKNGLKILDVGLGAEMGIRIKDRVKESENQPGFDPAEHLCGFRSDSRATILGLDLIPADYDDGVSYPEESIQKDCAESIQTIIEQIDRVRKAYADARELVRQYEYFKSLGRTFGGAANGGNLCQQIAKNPPRGFPVIDDPAVPDDCSVESVEMTLNRFIWYYNVVVIGELRAKAEELASKLDLWIAIDEEHPVLDVPLVDEQEDITLFNQTFMIGPVPVNLEVMLPITYGFSIKVFPKLALGQLAKKLIIPGEDDLTGSDPFAQLTLAAAPNAGASVTLFAGVGFDIGFAAAKFGVEGGISLGHLTLPAHGSVGIAAGVEKDERPLNPEFANLFDTRPTTEALVPKQKVKFSMFYEYGVDLQIRDVLDGFLNGRLKLKFFWFSLSYRARLLTFKGLCSERHKWASPSQHPGEERKRWCDVELFNSGINPFWDWGTLQMPMLFQPLKWVSLPDPALPAPAADAKFMTGRWFDPVANKLVGGAQELFYDSLCQCLPDYDFTAEYNNPKQCYRDDDCCSNLCVDGTGPAAGRKICAPVIE